MHCKVIIFCSLFLVYICDSYKILLVVPIPLKSHSILGESFINFLISAGHTVSYITPYPVTRSHPNLSQIIIKPFNYKGVNLKSLRQETKSFKNSFSEMFNIAYSTLTDANVQELMNDASQTFDLVIAEWMYNDLYSGFSAVFNCPYIWFFTFHNDQDIMRLVHETPNPAITANMRTNNVPPFNFQQRVRELLYAVTSKVWTYFYYDPLQTNTYEELFGPVLAKRGKVLRLYEKIRYNASLVLVNSHLTIRDFPVMPQNVKAIGGFHISETSMPLSQELLDITENSEKDIVLFSLGSFLKAEDMPSYAKRDLLAMFSKLNYTILWKIEDQFEDLPSNVKTFAWLHTQGILAHPKCALFITHGGMLSLTESVHYGVPVIGIPKFADQEINLKTFVNRGVARMVPMSPLLADALKEAIHDLLSDPRYKKNMMKLSSLYHARPLPPGSELVYWVEHVVATRGALHLRSPALLVPWYQKYYIDLAALLIVLFISFRFLVNNVFLRIYKGKFMFCKNVRTLETKKNI